MKSRIALSCTGEGFGHVARTVALAGELKNNYDVRVFCPHSVRRFVREGLPELLVYSIPYFSFAKKAERIDYLQTLRQNWLRILQFPALVPLIARRLRRLGIEGVVCDYEPYLSYAAARLKLPVLQLNHPGVVLRSRVFSPDAVCAKIVSLLLEGRYHKRIWCSFYDGDVGPIIRPELLQAAQAREDFYVVYLKPSYRRPMLAALERMGVHNIEIFPNPDKDFRSYLARCKAVISSAGHQFISEALCLQKPVFVVPQHGQFEQQLNAWMLEASGWGEWSRMENLDEKLSGFLASVDRYPRTPKLRPSRFRLRNDLKTAVEMIDEFFSARLRTAARDLMAEKRLQSD